MESAMIQCLKSVSLSNHFPSVRDLRLIRAEIGQGVVEVVFEKAGTEGKVRLDMEQKIFLGHVLPVDISASELASEVAEFVWACEVKCRLMNVGAQLIIK